MLELVLFYIFATVAVVSAILMITRRNPIMSVLYLIANFFALAGMYLLLHAQFLAIIQIIVYAGAIMVLFLFVIMLLNVGDEQQLKEKLGYQKFIAVGFSVGFALEILYLVQTSTGDQYFEQSPLAAEIGTVEFIGKQLFTKYLFPFEITSILLLAAIVGAIVLAKKRFP